MNARHLLTGLSLALALALPQAATAAPSHHHHGKAASEVQLDHGRKWRTDEALRAGMSAISDLMGAARGDIEARRFTPARYTALADGVQARIDDIIAKCKLPEEADAQLHVVLERMIAGVDAMRAGKDRRGGAKAILHGLEMYGRGFDHPGWPALKEAEKR